MHGSGRTALIGICTAFFWVMATDALAQNTVRGSVTDTEGAPLPGARVILTELNQNLRVETKSGKGGRFVRSGVPSGRYRVECEFEGYSCEPTVVEIGGGVPQTNLDIQMVRLQSPHYVSGLKAFSDGRFEAAVVDMRTVLETRPDDERAHFVLGASLAELGQHEEALEHLLRAENARDEFASAPMLLVTIGRTYLLLDETVLAEKYFAKVDAPDAVAAAFADIGNRAFNRGDLEQAAVLFERALAVYPTDPDALFGLGLYRVKSDDIAGATELFQTLIASAPDHPKAGAAKDLLKSLAGRGVRRDKPAWSP
jgi:Flp pilus assembly protein TadD